MHPQGHADEQQDLFGRLSTYLRRDDGQSLGVVYRQYPSAS